MPSDEELLNDYRTNIETLAADLLNPYLARLLRHTGRLQAKELNDPVWGTVQVRPEEIVVLDSPLLQRLRRIKQLGIVHYVYPAATHSRLEHSLGVVHQVQNLVTSLNQHGLVEKHGTDTEPVLSKEYERILRLAALVHDVGHGALSHVSEYALNSDRACSDVRLAFQSEVTGGGERQLSEMASYYFVGSPAFRSLMDEAAKIAGLASISDLGQIQRLIIGKQIAVEFPLLHEFISGPYDADKLDYLTRDATMCGVPRVTDVPRLIQKVRSTRLDRDQLTRRLRSKIGTSTHGYTVTGISRSGGRALDELSLARTLMFDKVYRHQKVRAVEAMASQLVRRLVGIAPWHPAETILRFSDDELLSLDYEGVLRKVGRPRETLGDEDGRSIGVVCDLAERIRERRLFVRGYAFSSTMTDDAYRLDPDHTTGLKKFQADCDRPEQVGDFIHKVVERVREVMGLLGVAVPEELEKNDLTAYVVLSPAKPAPKTASADTGHAHLIDDDSRLTQEQDDAAETSPWSDAYVATRDLSYVFCPSEISPFVFLAVEAVLREGYSIRTPESMLLYSKQDRTAIQKAKTALQAKGWYANKPADLGPMPPTLMRADLTDRLESLLSNFEGYSGPAQAHIAGTSDRPLSTIQDQRVIDFVRQFKSDDLVDTALTVLEHVRVIGRRDAGTAMSGFLETHAEFRGASYSPLGTAKDSSSLLTYYIGDIAGQYSIEPQDLRVALVRDTPILFVDDLTGTGNQAIDIFESWLGEDRTTGLSEERDVLEPVFQDRMRTKKIGLVFVASLGDAADRVQERLREIGLDVTVYSHLGDTSLPFLDSINLPTQKLAAFREAAQATARELLKRYDGKARDAAWIESRLLGYGNRGLLLTSTYNTPTATLTCLWAPGGGDLPHWTPLLPRRTKK